MQMGLMATPVYDDDAFILKNKERRGLEIHVKAHVTCLFRSPDFFQMKVEFTLFVKFFLLEQ